VCFANPGTSEMHFVAALDAVPEMRAVLALFEGVVTGAADGYGRMTGARRRPCSTWARGSETASPICTTPGEPARRSSTSSASTPPTTSDSMLPCNPTSSHLPATSRSGSGSVPPPTTSPPTPPTRWRAAMGRAGGVATLVVPADVSWGTVAGTSARQRPVPPVGSVPTDTIESVSKVLDSKNPS
jgi:acetolactate synthase-1/2/3 large subunit